MTDDRRDHVRYICEVPSSNVENQPASSKGLMMKSDALKAEALHRNLREYEINKPWLYHDLILFWSQREPVPHVQRPIQDWKPQTNSAYSWAFSPACSAPKSDCCAHSNEQPDDKHCGRFRRTGCLTWKRWRTLAWSSPWAWTMEWSPSTNLNVMGYEAAQNVYGWCKSLDSFMWILHNNFSQIEPLDLWIILHKWCRESNSVWKISSKLSDMFRHPIAHAATNNIWPGTTRFYQHILHGMAVHAIKSLGPYLMNENLVPCTRVPSAASTFLMAGTLPTWMNFIPINVWLHARASQIAFQLFNFCNLVALLVAGGA